MGKYLESVLVRMTPEMKHDILDRCKGQGMSETIRKLIKLGLDRDRRFVEHEGSMVDVDQVAVFGNAHEGGRNWGISFKLKGGGSEQWVFHEQAEYLGMVDDIVALLKGS